MIRIGCAIAILALSPTTSAADARFPWPNGVQAAVSLAYDDALPSHLDHAIPALNRLSLKGSFYLTLNSETLAKRLPEWRSAAASGHELGNHTLFHQCSRRVPGREWVKPENDLDQISITQWLAQVRLANSMLHAIDARSERSFTVPCGDLEASGVPLLPEIKSDFVAIKSGIGDVIPNMHRLDPYSVPVVVPTGVTGKQLIEWVDAAAAQGTMINFTFHGIGGDQLAVSHAAHEELLTYLAAHRDRFWTDTFVAIMKYVKQQQEAKH